MKHPLSLLKRVTRLCLRVLASLGLWLLRRVVLRVASFLACLWAFSQVARLFS